MRSNLEAEEGLKHALEHLSELEQDVEILSKRLEFFDPSYRWENDLFRRIASVLMTSRVSACEAFDHFDSSGDGVLNKTEFHHALERMGINDMSETEKDVIFASLDTNASGGVSHCEFSRKLERFGVRTRSKEELIILSMIEAAQRANVTDLSTLFEMIDKHKRGYISREDFIDLFNSMEIKTSPKDLYKFVDHFWKDREAGIDYQGFLRIFSRYKMKLAQEEKSKNVAT